MTGQDDRDRSTANTAHGDPSVLVQAGTVHGDVRIVSEPRPTMTVPRQLPFSTRGFVDRTAHLRYLDVLAEETATGVPIAVLSGPPGVGKSAVAVHWAHRARRRFPDGDLYVSMHGHVPGPRAEASQALDGLLRALGVGPDRVPLDLDNRAALYRSELVGRRLLVVIDDALDPAQIRPLLPAAPGCMVIVTSRNTLSGLVAREGAQRFPLPVLPTADSIDLLRRSVGPRVDDSPEAALQLVGHCARLPLALRVVAERLIDRSDATVDDLVAELAAEESRLDTLSEEDELSDLRAVMTTSYEALDDEDARFLRRLGLHPGADFSSSAAGALAGTPVSTARRHLERLVRAHLVERLRTDRYRLHDLVRLFAVERVSAEEGPAAASEAVGRVARWYTWAAARAQSAEHPNFPVVPGEDGAGEGPTFDSPREALTWFEQERANLLAALRAAYEHGHDDVAWRLPASVYPLFEVHRHWHEWRDMHTLGLQAAQRAGSAFGRARNHLGMGDAEWLLDELDSAVRHYRAALEANQSSDSWVEGFALRQLGVVAWQLGERDDAVAHIGRAIAVFRSSGERRGEAMGQLSRAEFNTDLGRFTEALSGAQAAVEAFDDIGDIWSVAWGNCTLGRILTGLGREAEAVRKYEFAIEEFVNRGDEESRATALIGLGEAQARLGDPGRARESLGAALEYLRDHGDARADEVGERLERLGPG